MPRMTQDRPNYAWISEAERLEFNAKPVRVDGIPPNDESGHFYVCEGCGQAVDMRKLGDVLYHDQVDHKPLAVN